MSTLHAPLRSIKTVRDPGDPPPIREETDSMAPERVEARVRNLGDACASKHGGRPADFALGAYRVEYEMLWQRFQAECIPFLSPSWGNADDVA